MTGQHLAAEGREIDGSRLQLRRLGEIEQAAQQAVQAGDLRQDGVQGAPLALAIAGQGVLGLEAHGGQRIADLVGDPGGHPAQRRQPLAGVDLGGQALGFGAGLGQALAGLVERGEHPVQFAFAGKGEGGQVLAGARPEITFDPGDMPRPLPGEPAKQQGGRQHGQQQKAEAQFQLALAAALGKGQAGQGPGGEIRDGAGQRTSRHQHGGAVDAEAVAQAARLGQGGGGEIGQMPALGIGQAEGTGVGQQPRLFLPEATGHAAVTQQGDGGYPGKALAQRRIGEAGGGAGPAVAVEAIAAGDDLAGLLGFHRGLAELGAFRLAQ